MRLELTLYSQNVSTFVSQHDGPTAGADYSVRIPDYIDGTIALETHQDGAVRSLRVSFEDLRAFAEHREMTAKLIAKADHIAQIINADPTADITDCPDGA